MATEWNFVFKKYLQRLISPDGRDTYESSPSLVEKIIEMSDIHPADTVIDIGSGWGNITIAASLKALRVIGIEPNKENILEAKNRTNIRNIKNIDYISGSFENPKCRMKADIIISANTFHQVEYDNKLKSLENIKNLLNTNGRFILCDTFIFFDPEKEPKHFNEVYRYLLWKTTPKNIYENYIKPRMKDDSYIYTWEDMKRYTPRKNWFYSKNDIESILDKVEMKILKIEELCPFFGILAIGKKINISNSS